MHVRLEFLVAGSELRCKFVEEDLPLWIALGLRLKHPELCDDAFDHAGFKRLFGSDAVHHFFERFIERGRGEFGGEVDARCELFFCEFTAFGSPDQLRLRSWKVCYFKREPV